MISIVLVINYHSHSSRRWGLGHKISSHLWWWKPRATSLFKVGIWRYFLFEICNLTPKMENTYNTKTVAYDRNGRNNDS